MLMIYKCLKMLFLLVCIKKKLTRNLEFHTRWYIRICFHDCADAEINER